MTALQLEDVWFTYESEPVIRGVSFSVSEGEVVALLGPNGAGKTTLTRLIMGLSHPMRGEIRVAGVPNTDQPPEDIARDAAYVFQHPDRQLFARTVLEEVAFGPLQMGRADHAARDLAFHALLELGLETRAAIHPYDLPPAERKLVALAAALAQDPRLLVLDEPTQGFDAAHRDRLCEIVRRVAQKKVAVLAVTHDLTFVAEACDRAIIMQRGAIVATMTARDLVLDEPRARDLGLAVPPAARLSAALRLPGTPVRRSEIIPLLRGAVQRVPDGG